MNTHEKLTENELIDAEVLITKQNDLLKRGSKRDSKLRFQYEKNLEALAREIEDLFQYFGLDLSNEDQEECRKMGAILGLFKEIMQLNDQEALRERWTFKEIQDRVDWLEANLHNLLNMHDLRDKFDAGSKIEDENMPEWVKCFAKVVHNRIDHLEELERIENDKMSALWDHDKGEVMEDKREEYSDLLHGAFQTICETLDAYYCWEFGLSYIIAPAALKGASEWVNEPGIISPKERKWWLKNYLELLCIMLDYHWLTFELYFDEYPEADQTFEEATKMLKKVKRLRLAKTF